MSPPILSAAIAHRIVLGLMLLQLAWFGFWVIGIDLAISGVAYLPMPGVNAMAIEQMALLHNVLIGHLMVACLVIAAILHLYSHKLTLVLYGFVVAMHLYLWIWFVYSSRFTSPAGFVVILAETVVITLLVMLRRGKFE